AVLVPLALLAWNAAHGDAPLPAALVGFPMPLATARAAHVWPIQRVGEDGAVHWRLWTRLGMDADAAYDGLAARGLERIWVTAKVPLVALMAVGAAASLVWGNLLLRLAMAVAG
ncbi:MAG: hypothetical protein LC620_08685, partial [Halobacteriales archaeon]|nr:hypothetical protein [Halobacteriales archaeon]